jgi:o-succinylbenzoate---CoA ligase
MFSLITAERSWTPSQVGCAVAGACRRLEQLGVHQETRVGIAWPTSPELIFLILALYQLGAVGCLISTRMPPSALQQLEQQVDLMLPFQVWPEGEQPLHVTLSPSEVPVSQLWTSGSTGTPKPVLLTAANHYWSALGSQHNLPLSTNDHWLLNLPLYHTGGLSIVWRCLMAGATLVLDEGPCTHVSMVATQLVRLLRAGTRPWPGLRVLLLGGGPAPVSLLQEALQAGWPVYPTYGLTEMASQVATAAVPGGSMQLLPYRQLQVDPSGQIMVGGKTLASGLGDWYPTRDLGRLEADGSLTVLGRLDNQFVSGGEKIQPEEIEALLLEQPSVHRALVVPVADPEYGERPMAVIEGSANLDLLREQLPGYKIPIGSISWPEGDIDLKPSRLKLRQYAEGLMHRSSAVANHS